MTFSQWKTPTEKHTKILSVAKEFDAKLRDKKSMFFYGKPGTGKTSLARIIVSKAKKEGRLAMYRTVQEIISDCKRRMEDGASESPELYINNLCRFDGLLVIDEIGRTKGGDWDKNQILFPLIDRRLDKYNIWISNWSLDELSKHYDAAIASRMQTASIIGFSDMEDYRVLL